MVDHRITDLLMSMDFHTLETGPGVQETRKVSRIFVTVLPARSWSILSVPEPRMLHAQQRQDNPEVVAALIEIKAGKEPAEAETELSTVNTSKRFYCLPRPQGGPARACQRLAWFMSGFVQ